MEEKGCVVIQQKCWLERAKVWKFFVKKVSKLSVSEVTEIEEGKGDKELQSSNLFTVCQRR